MNVVIWVLIGVGIGAVWGHFAKSPKEGVPKSNWQRGAIFGALAGAGLSLLFGGGASSASKDTPNVRHITEAEFEQEVLQSGKPVVVDFYADWCGPCRQLAPMLDSVAGRFTNQVKVVKVNVDHASDLAQKYGIEGIPTLKFFQAREVVGGTVGLPSRRELEGYFEGLAKNQPEVTRN